MSPNKNQQMNTMNRPESDSKTISLSKYKNLMQKRISEGKSIFPFKYEILIDPDGTIRITHPTDEILPLITQLSR